MAKWQDQQLQVLTAEDHARWQRVRPSGVRCGLCNGAFIVGETYRWVYCNDDARTTGNFFTCVACDGDDVKARRLALYDEFVRLDRLFGEGQ